VKVDRIEEKVEKVVSYSLRRKKKCSVVGYFIFLAFMYMHKYKIADIFGRDV
jgi:hypothetical protein